MREFCDIMSKNKSILKSPLNEKEGQVSILKSTRSLSLTDESCHGILKKGSSFDSLYNIRVSCLKNPLSEGEKGARRVALGGYGQGVGEPRGGVGELGVGEPGVGEPGVGEPRESKDQQVGSGSVADRIKSLRSRGENDWRKRVVPVKNVSCKSVITSRQEELTESLRENWKVRVQEKDVDKFTVKGMILRDGVFKGEELCGRGQGGELRGEELRGKGEEFKREEPCGKGEESEEFMDFNSLRIKDYLLKDKFNRPRKQTKNWKTFYSKDMLPSPSAVAGLQSTEDFTSVKLKSGQPLSSGVDTRWLYMLKGRRQVEPRLVGASVSNLCLGDSFILLFKQFVYIWTPLYCNLLERSKTEEIVKRLDNKLLKKYVEFEGKNWNEFLEILDDGVIDLKKNLLNDDIYENKLITRVYKVKGDKLEKIYNFDYRVLDSEEVLVFDYETEVYLWCGSRSSLEQKNVGSDLSLKIREGRFSKIYEFMEPIWFRMKFYDWPMTDLSKQFIPGFQSETKALLIDPVDLNSVEFEQEPDLQLEGFNLGTDLNEVRRVSDEDRRLRSIETVTLEKWSVDVSGSFSKMNSNLEMFETSGVYILRWVYNVQYLTRDLKGNMSKIPTSKGRDRICWFFWYGSGVQGVVQRASVGAVFSGVTGGRGVFNDIEGIKVPVEEGQEPLIFPTLFPLPMKIVKNYDSVIKVYTLSRKKLVEIPYRRDLLRAHSIFTFEINNENYYFLGNEIKNFNEKLIKDKKLISQELIDFYFDGVFNDKIYKVFKFDNKLALKGWKDFTCFDLQLHLNIGQEVNDLKALFIEGHNNTFLIYAWDTQQDSTRWNGYRKGILVSVLNYTKDNGKSNWILSNGYHSNLIKLFPYWDLKCGDDVELKSLESDGRLVEEIENGKYLISEILENYNYYVDTYLDLNRIIEIVNDEDLIRIIGVDLNNFLQLPFWKQNKLRRQFIQTVF